MNMIGGHLPSHPTKRVLRGVDDVNMIPGSGYSLRPLLGGSHSLHPQVEWFYVRDILAYLSSKGVGLSHTGTSTQKGLQ